MFIILLFLYPMNIYCKVCSALISDEAVSVYLVSDRNSSGFSSAGRPAVYEIGEPKDFHTCKCQIKYIVCKVCK